ncbi:hypothetical protein G8A07_16615 [Roseateles sp. DAIF2]|uniref:hypothetical protein n=1 Tax=Roseateles sp. DAIF2 TaxID=2714952 RepID=UPI0018A2C9BF|nr:hypothetical protein [Roseateles sp. DAIF2]QPF74380.1 hypothetical protein G8A07_16615 [Roseateles sp. DAIF2]
MAAPDPQADALADARAMVARQLAERAADSGASLSELQALHERLRLIDAGLAARPPASKPRRIPPALLPALLIAALLSLADTVPIRSVPFSLELRAQSATLRFDNAGELEAQPVDAELRIEGQTLIESPAPALTDSVAAAGPDPLVLRAPQLTLRRLAYPAGATLVIAAGRQVQLGVDAPIGPLVAEIEFAGTATWRLGSGEASPSRDFSHAESLQASAGATAPGQRPPPLDLWLGRGVSRSYQWNGLRPTAVQFVARRISNAATPMLASSLEWAQLVLPATGAQVTLGAGDRLDLAGLTLERFEMTVGDSVGLKLAGTARVLATRTGDFERSLKPSLLEFLARNHAVGLFWSAGLLLWGAIAWIRKQFAAD